MPTLIGQSGPLAGRRFELDGDVVLGRENAAITLADEETSRRHAEIRVAAGVVVIEDLGSTNGTYVDGRRIDAATDLRGGEIIKMGQSTFTLEVEVAEPAPEPDRGATRIAPRPEPAGDPDKTAMRERPPAPPPPPEPIADPDVTALRDRPTAPPPPPPPAEPVVDPGHTQLRPRPPKRPEPAPEPIADAPDRTALRPRPPAREPAPAAAAPPPAPAPAKPQRAAASRAAAAAPKVDQPFGTFKPAGSARRRGVASRKVTPALVSMATIITTTAALIVYFAGR